MSDELITIDEAGKVSAPEVKWNKPWNRGKHTQLMGTPDHHACGDCEHFRVAGAPNRGCTLHPNKHIWFSTALHEIEEYAATSFTDETPRIEHPGQTMADVCPSYQLDSSFVGKEVHYSFDDSLACDEDVTYDSSSRYETS